MCGEWERGADNAQHTRRLSFLCSELVRLRMIVRAVGKSNRHEEHVVAQKLRAHAVAVVSALDHT